MLVNSGSSATFTAPVTNATAYAWTLDGATVGFNSATFAYSPGNFDVGPHDLIVYQTLATGRTTSKEWGVRVRIPIPASPLQYYVSPSGSDSNNGSISAPFKTLEKAQTAIRNLSRPLAAGGVTVYLRSGTYWRTSTFFLTGSDSGTPSAPIIYSAYPGENVTLSTGTALAASAWSQLALSETNRVVAGIDPTTIWETDASHFTNKGPYPAAVSTWPVRNSQSAAASSLPEVFYKNARAWLSRYPNHNLSADYLTPNLKMDGVAADITGTGYLNSSGTYLASSGSAVSVGGAFHYYSTDADHVSRWQSALTHGGLWLQGFWRVTWQSDLLQVFDIDTLNQVVELAPGATPSGGIGNKYTRPIGNLAEPYWAINLLEEMDQPGEWCVDFNRKKLYFLMNQAGAPPDGSVVVADYTGPVVQIAGSNIILQSLNFAQSLGMGVYISGTASNNLVVGCSFNGITNTGVAIESGSANGVVSCSFSEMGSTGLSIDSASTSGSSTLNQGNFIVNNKISGVGRYAQMYQPGVNIVAPSAGNRIGHNSMRDLPHMGVQLSGYRNLYDCNDIGMFGLLVDDNGAFYSFSDSFGNDTFRYNYEHDTPLASAITFDGGDNARIVSGHFFGNLSQQNSACEGQSLGIGHCSQVDAVNNLSIGGGRYGSFIFTSDSQQNVNNNVAVAGYYAPDFTWTLVSGSAGSYVYTPSTASVIANGPNLSYSSDPGFINMNGEDLRLRPDSRLFTDLPNFKPTPFELIGLYNDEYRSDGPLYKPFVTNYGGTFISGTQALLTGTLVYPIFEKNTSVAIYYGPADSGTNAGSWPGVANLGPVASGSFSALVSATSNQPVYYRVLASNTAGQMWSERTAAAYPSSPGAPSGLTVSPGYAQNTLTWTSGTYAAGYTIQRASSANGLYLTIASGVTGTSYTDTALITGATYYYTVVGANASGTSSASSSVSGTPVPGTAIKANNSDNLTLGSSWSMGVPPTIIDGALIDSTCAYGSLSLGAALSAAGLQVTSPVQAITINSGGGALTLGSAGIDLSAATQNLTLNASVALAASQVWTTGTGRTLTINGAISDAGLGLTLSGSGTFVFSGTNSIAGGLSITPPAAGLPSYKFGGTNPSAYLQLTGQVGPVTANGRLDILNGAIVGTLAGSGSSGFLTYSDTNNNLLTFLAGSSFSMFRFGADLSSATLTTTGTAPVFFSYFGFNTNAPNAAYTLNGGNWTFNQIGQNNTGAQISGTVTLTGSASASILTQCAFSHGVWNVINGSLLFGGPVSETGGNSAGSATPLVFNVNNSGGGPGTLAINGSLTLADGGGNTQSNSATIGSGGIMTLQSGNLTLGSTTARISETDSVYLLDGGKLVVNGAILAASPATGQTRAFNWSGGQLTAATITPSAGFNTVANGGITPTDLAQTSGTLAPGDMGKAGKTTINGNYLLGPAGTLSIELSGTTQASGFQSGQYDYVFITGSASLGGKLEVRLVNGFTPSSTQAFTILTATSGLVNSSTNIVSGTLATADGGALFQVTTSGSSITLSGYRLAPPTIVTPPASGAVDFGSPFTLSVVATGPSNSPITYQWRLNGTPIASATTSTYAVASAQMADGGSYDVVVSNGGGQVTSAPATLTVNPLLPPSISGGLGAQGVVGMPFAYQILASSSHLIYSASGLPAGLSVDASTGLISGIPAVAGTSSVAISAANLTGTASATLTLAILAPAPVITSAPTAICNAGSPFSYQITATNNPTSFGASGLPAGLAINLATGLISGTPSAVGASTAVISASNAAGVGAASLAFTINAPVIYWSATASGTAWSSGSNWIGGSAPANSLTANVAGFDQTSYASQPNAGSTSICGLTIGDSITATAPLTIAGSNLSLGSAGIYMAANSGAATITAPLTLAAPQTWINNSGAMLTGSGAIATGSNSLTIAGSGPIAISASVTGTAGMTMAGTGTLTLNNQLNTAGQAFRVLSGTTFLNSGRNTAANLEIDGGSVFISGSGTPNRYSTSTNLATLKIAGGSLSYIHNGGYGIRLNGDNGASSSGTPNCSFAATQTAGLVSVSGSGSGSPHFNMGSTSGTDSTLYTLSGSGTLSITGGSNWVLGADTEGTSLTAFFLNGGKLIVANTMSGGQGTGARQAFVWSGGVLAVNTYTATNLTTGTAIAVSATSNTLANAGGILAPGDQGTPGLTTITGNYAVTSSNALLDIDLTGTTPAAAFQNSIGTYDNVKVTGSAILGGNLAVTVANNFVPAATGTFTILTGTAVSGSFGNVTFGGRLLTNDGLGTFLGSKTGTSVYLSSFVQTGPLPSVTTVGANAITGTSATLNGTVNPNGSTTSVTFDSGTDSSYGTSLVASPASVSGSANTPVSAVLTGLTPNSSYHFRVKAVSSSGTANGADLAFTTGPVAPSIFSATSASGTAGTEFTYQIAANCNPLSFNADGLLPGLSINTSSGLISGIPSASGSSSATLYASNLGGTGMATLALSILPTQIVPVSSSEESQSSVLSISGSTGNAYFLNSVPSHTYQLQLCDDLQTGSWQNYGAPQAGTGATLAFPVSIDLAKSRRFYRFLIQP